MPTQKYIESLHIEDNAFELSEDTVLGYLAHYHAPYTGGGEISVPPGLKFAAYGPMRGDALYMDLIGENEELLNSMKEQQKAEVEKLADRLAGFSFFITEEQVKTLPLVFSKGSRERLLEIFELLRNEPAPPPCNNPKDVTVRCDNQNPFADNQYNNESTEDTYDLPF